MKKILIICPTFLPVNTPDQHRVRLSIPWFQKFGWDCTVLAVEAQFVEAPVDQYLKLLPDPCRVIRVRAFSTHITRMFGLGNLGYRCWWQMFRAGNNLIENERFDLIYFSTTVFPVMTLGRLWKNMFKTPFVLDFQDPWRNDFYLSKPKKERPPKFTISHFLDSLLEKWTVPSCDGVVAVSDQYPMVLSKRYGMAIPNSVITFSASSNDFNLDVDLGVENKVFSKDKSRIVILYIGVVPPPMLPVIDVLFKGLANAQKRWCNIDVYFLGTSYDINADANTPIKQLAVKNGLANFFEQTSRISHFEVIRLLKDASIMLVPGTVDEGYTASKIYNYILSMKPIFAFTHEKSSVSAILKGCNTGPVITFNNESELVERQKDLEKALAQLLANLPEKADINWDFYRPYSDEVMALRQIDFFNKVINDSKK